MKLNSVSCIVELFSQFNITKITKSPEMNKLPPNFPVILYYKKGKQLYHPNLFSTELHFVFTQVPTKLRLFAALK